VARPQCWSDAPFVPTERVAIGRVMLVVPSPNIIAANLLSAGAGAAAEAGAAADHVHGGGRAGFSLESLLAMSGHGYAAGGGCAQGSRSPPSRGSPRRRSSAPTREGAGGAAAVGKPALIRGWYVDGAGKQQLYLTWLRRKTGSGADSPPCSETFEMGEVSDPRMRALEPSSQGREIRGLFGADLASSAFPWPFHTVTAQRCQ
jgi:hypothetical protein